MEIEDRVKNLEVWRASIQTDVLSKLTEDQERAAKEFIEHQATQIRLHKISIRNYLILGTAQVVGFWVIVILLFVKA